MTRPELIRLEHEPALGEEVAVSGESLIALQNWSPHLGSAFTLRAPSGADYRGRLLAVDQSQGRFFVFEKMSGPSESALEIFLLPALPARERMELVIEKATELGVNLIAPWKAERGISLAERENKQRKAHRWQALATRAAKQCRRGLIPVIMPYGELASALTLAQEAEFKIALWEKAEKPLREILPAGPIKSVALLVGPEGGLTERELARAEAVGFQRASLGSRVLRAETAAIIGVALLQFALGDLGRL